MSKHRAGRESDALMFRQAHHIMAEMPADTGQARKIAKLVLEMIDFEEERLKEPQADLARPDCGNGRLTLVS
jgi:hypothetical protein